MERTYRSFTFPYWEGQADPAERLLSDQVLMNLFDGLEQTRADVNMRSVEKNSALASRREDWPRERTMAFASDVWLHMGGPSFKKLVDFELARRPLRLLPDDDTPQMKSGGRCGPPGILFRFDNSLSDPVYVAHETGHLVADRDGYYAANICEIQGFFAQEAAYDLLAIRMEDRGAAARLHRLQEFLELQKDRDAGRALLHKERPENFKEDAQVFQLHQHVSAMPLAIAMYRLMHVMPPAERKRALDALYSDSGATFESVTGAFGLKTEDDFHMAGIYAGNIMRNEAISLGFASVSASAPKAGAAYPP